MKPNIGIPMHYGTESGKKAFCIGEVNINAIYLNGGLPITLPLCNDKESIEVYLDMIDGLYFVGGYDISPLEYNENPLPQLGLVSPKRDQFEINLFKAAIKRNIPILGICRGSQLINVALGGTLYQDIYTQRKNVIEHSFKETDGSDTYHKIEVLKNSKLYDIFKTTEIFTNSIHHQSIKDLAKKLKVTAYSSDGIIEGYEATDMTFCLGVQWHPELMLKEYDQFNGIYKKLIKASTNYQLKKKIKL